MCRCVLVHAPPQPARATPLAPPPIHPHPHPSAIVASHAACCNGGEGSCTPPAAPSPMCGKGGEGSRTPPAAPSSRAAAARTQPRQGRSTTTWRKEAASGRRGRVTPPCPCMQAHATAEERGGSRCRIPTHELALRVALPQREEEWGRGGRRLRHETRRGEMPAAWSMGGGEETIAAMDLERELAEGEIRN
ncbi:hypothetical protein PVAP13_5NG294481 [Panicum virgatum]|uniref:Uncharacterized protein n=1 Tax=Panicum virgatum TaxID=38727 RepID=A0A8T0RSB9_PANVG|nr:hypothetical protein PVAP13_5NG294481 [Panicum virgatum]